MRPRVLCSNGKELVYCTRLYTIHTLMPKITFIILSEFDRLCKFFFLNSSVRLGFHVLIHFFLRSFGDLQFT